MSLGATGGGVKTTPLTRDQAPPWCAELLFELHAKQRMAEAA